MQKVFILGSQGMLGRSLVKTLSRERSISVVTAARYGGDYNFDFMDDKKLC